MRRWWSRARDRPTPSPIPRSALKAASPEKLKGGRRSPIGWSCRSGRVVALCHQVGVAYAALRRASALYDATCHYASGRRRYRTPRICSFFIPCSLSLLRVVHGRRCDFMWKSENCTVDEMLFIFVTL